VRTIKKEENEDEDRIYDAEDGGYGCERGGEIVIFWGKSQTLPLKRRVIKKPTTVAMCGVRETNGIVPCGSSICHQI
jgi:hypothetical protein